MQLVPFVSIEIVYQQLGLTGTFAEELASFHRFPGRGTFAEELASSHRKFPGRGTFAEELASSHRKFPGRGTFAEELASSHRILGMGIGKSVLAPIHNQRKHHV